MELLRHTKNGKVTSWNEKPEIKANVNMGCYVMEPGCFEIHSKEQTIWNG